ncbi:MAG: SDR family oxidoreductase [Verrucomicrobia bacterium]|nr:SDR family oxidoreductase [Verrucomicrobiota bacterium]
MCKRLSADLASVDFRVLLSRFSIPFFGVNIARSILTPKNGLKSGQNNPENQRSLNSQTVSKILVTGGAGFLGSHLIDRLLERGDQVFCLDNFYTGSRDNIAHLLDHPQFTLIEQDVCAPLDLSIDLIYNLACPASPVHYQHDPVQTTRTNVHGALQMLELAKKNGARILQASTSEVYGDPEVHPQVESYWGHVNPIGIRSCYDEGKRCAETLFFDFHRQYGLPIKVARIFNTYGPRMHPNDGRVVSNFIVQALQNAPITLYGKGTQTRSFCFVDDLIDGLILLMESKEGFTGPVNLGNPVEFSIQELAEHVISLTGSSSPLVYHPLPSDDPKQRKPDITLARTILGWQPQIALKEGLLATIAYFKTICPVLP